MDRRERFNVFYEELASHIGDNHPEVSFFGYGSTFDHSVKMPSDIDGGIVMPTIVTDKDAVLDISKKYMN